jgi:FMN phosphatase YigB (HAD superfamily)
MTRVILFDLGETLEHNGDLREDSLLTLEKLKEMKDKNNESVILGLASDFKLPDDWGPPPLEEQIKRSKEDYFMILESLGIQHFFKPVEQNVILSTEVGRTKNQDIQKFFQTGVNKIGNTSFNQIIFITENIQHIRSANILGIKTIFLKLDNNSNDNNDYTISKLIESVNIIEEWINN